MSNQKEVTVVGGGIAGLSLGILLCDAGVPTTIVDAGSYPRHRVCGEFIHGHGQAVLFRMGLLRRLAEMGAQEAFSMCFYDVGDRIVEKSLVDPAFCISRHAFDKILVDRFQELGGVLQTNTRWRGEWGAGIVRATGRKAYPTSNGWRFIGMKMHAQELDLDADLEMHWGPNGYVGLCRVENNRVNVCGLFRSRETVPSLGREAWDHPLVGPENSPLRRKLRNAVWDTESFQSVAALSFSQPLAKVDSVINIGDAYALIPPLTGNGMSMALESAEAAVGPLLLYSNGWQSWEESCRQVVRICRRKFRHRMRTARALQSLMFRPRCQSAVFALAKRFQPVWSRLLKNTR